MRIEPWEIGAGRTRAWARLIGLSALTGAVLGVIGFLNGDLLICIFDWLCLIVGGAVVAGLLVPALVKLGRRVGLAFAPALAVSVLLTAAPISVLAALFGYWAWPKVAGRLAVGDWYIETLLVEALVVGLWVLVEAMIPAGDSRAGQPEQGLVAPAAGSALAEDDVACLGMEDHYVRVYRSSGASLELMRLQDAIAQYGVAEGLRVHRSWWVARAAVSSVDRHGRNWRLRLKSGLVVPVARNCVAELRRLGWIR
jgi:hypothetical protein